MVEFLSERLLLIPAVWSIRPKVKFGKGREGRGARGRRGSSSAGLWSEKGRGQAGGSHHSPSQFAWGFCRRHSSVLHRPCEQVWFFHR